MYALVEDINLDARIQQTDFADLQPSLGAIVQELLQRLSADPA